MGLTITEVGQRIAKKHKVKPFPGWRIRRIVDDLSLQGLVSVERAGLYRVIDDTEVDTVADELQRRGLLPHKESEAATC